MYINVSIKKTLNICLVIILTITTILNSGYALSTVNTSIGLLPLGVTTILLVFLHVLHLIGSNSIPTTNAYFVLFGCSFLFPVLANFTVENTIPTLRFFALLFVAFYVTENYSFSDFAKVYIKLLLLLTYISFPLYICSVLGKLVSFPIIQNINGVNYRNLIIYFELIHNSLTRNCSIFWEPGIFATFLIIGILLEIYVIKKTSYQCLIVFSIGIFTTMSGAGIVLWALTMVLFIFRTMNKGMKYVYISLIILSAGFAMVFFEEIKSFLLLWNYDFFIKFFSNNESLTTRLLSPYNNFMIFLENPILGKGFIQASYTYENMMVGNVVAQTSTTTQLMSILGVSGLLLHVVPILGIFSSKKLFLFEKFLISLIILLMLNKEPHLNFLNTYILLAYLSRLWKRKENNEQKVNSD